MKSYYVYIVECDDASYYIGITNDVERRVAEHNFGIDKLCYTFKRRPVKLAFSSEFHEVEDAIAFEKQVKGWSRKKKRAMIDADWAEVVRLSRESRPKTEASKDG